MNNPLVQKTLLDYSRSLTTNSEKHIVHRLKATYYYCETDEEFKRHALDYTDSRYRHVAEQVLKLIYSEDRVNKTIEGAQKAKEDMEENIRNILNTYQASYGVVVDDIELNKSRSFGDHSGYISRVLVEVKI